MKKKIFYLILLLLGISMSAKAQDDITLTITLNTAFDMNTQVVTPATVYDNINAAIVVAFDALGEGKTLETHAQNVKKVILTGEAPYCFFDFRGIRTAFPNVEEIDMSGASLWENTIQSPIQWSASANKYAGYDPGQGGGALCNLSKLKTVVFPETLTTIGNYALRGCTQLTGVELPAGLISISREGFQGCTNLTIPKGLPEKMNGSLGQSAFDGCLNLALTTLPANLGITGDATYVFRGCTLVTFSEINGKIVGNDTKRRYSTSLFESSGVSIKEIPEGIYTIGANAFYKCVNIDTITFPETLGKAITGTNGITSSILSQAFALEEGSNVQRVYIFKSENPPLGGTTADAFNKGSAIDPAAVVYVPNNTAVETFKAVTPYSSMEVRALLNTITVNTGTGATVSTEYGTIESTGGNIQVSYGDNITFTFTPNYGYNISKIDVDGIEVTDGISELSEGVKQLTLENVMDKHTVSLEYTQSHFFVIVDPGTDGTIEVKDVSEYSIGVYAVEAGGNITFAFTANTDYIIDKVLLDGEPVELENNTYTIADIDANHKITVQYLKNYYIITVDPGANGTITTDYGTITDNKIQVTREESITFTITPNSGYILWRTTLDGTPVTPAEDNTYTLSNVTQDYTISTEFGASPTATIYVSPDGDDTDGSSWEKAYKTFGKACKNIAASSTTILHLKEGATFTLPVGGDGSGENGRIDFKDANIIIEGNNAIIQPDNTNAPRMFRMGYDRTVRIRNLTMQNGNGAPGAAIYFAGELLDIENCIFKNNKAKSGGVIASRGKNVVIRNSNFINQSTESSGYGGVITHGGKSSVGGGSLIIDGCTFANNALSGTSFSGSVICTREETNNVHTYLDEIRIANSTFYQNGSSSNNAVTGAVICLETPRNLPNNQKTSVALINNTFYKNQTGVIYMKSDNYDLTLVNNVIAGNLGYTDCAIGTEKTTDSGRTSIVAKNNVIIAKAALNANVSLSEFDDSNSLTSTTATAPVDALFLASELVTPVKGIPYLPIKKGNSPLVDAATTSVPGQIIPSRDAFGTIRGNKNQTGNGYDIGAFEYSNRSVVWKGDNSSVWQDNRNWEGNAVPSYTRDILIPAGAATFPTIPDKTTVNTITFERGAKANLSGSLTATEAVKVDYTVEREKWYSIGFPFDVAAVYSHYFESQAWPPYDLTAYSEESHTGDFWLKAYNPSGEENLFYYVSEIEAGKGYIIQFPSWFDGTKITFISESNPTLDNAGVLPVENNYQLVANPTLNDLTLTAPNGNTYYYTFKANSGTNGEYVRLTDGSETLSPFESAITISASDASSLAYSIGASGELTGLNPVPFIADDPVIATHYYTFSGLEIRKPLEPGIYLVKKVHRSGKNEIIKTVYNKK